MRLAALTHLRKDGKSGLQLAKGTRCLPIASALDGEADLRDIDAMNHTITTGGCQCGAVRYRIEGPLGNAGFCYCRMCQKAFGSIGAPLVSVPPERLTWTRGTPATFRSSPVVARGFCRDCGTPLFMLEDDYGPIEIAIGTLDDPAAAPPDHVAGVESKLPWVDDLPGLPAKRTDEDRTPQDLAKLGSLQHPDHDTAEWPEATRKRQNQDRP